MTTATHDVKDWLRKRRDKNALHLELMALHYDLEGALADRQYGLAWWTQRQIMVCAAKVFLAGASAPVAPGADRVETSLKVLEAVERTSTRTGDLFWQLYLRPRPHDEVMGKAIDQTLEFIESELALPWASSREDTVREWAADTKGLREIAKHLNIARSDDWYLSASGDPEVDWYAEVLEVLEDDASR